ncbi:MULTISPECIES: tetratricopeptide repeat protein [Pseudoalteromonas]|uniref:Uncharacterized protein n=1 Tax=Pseudoalteromonas amylolytica TaxID=1859457 RepID=A0A1S1MSD5_9GAMM|nr:MULTISPECIES: hypothetical protein [Pseudoalteromonas]OHU86250.1 hypothetical protein BFC16_16230 [Pseudoalteromonas sp. JW3]OHU89645.1 hypothetical protein BET10_16090 [Pseudoalteromonas amylolytica]
MYHKRSVLITIMTCWALLSTPVCSETFIPTSEEFILDSWPLVDDNAPAQMSLDDIEQLLTQAQWVGKSAYNISRAQTQLQPYLQTQSPTPQAWYLSARILQQQHKFKAALEALQKSLTLDASNVSAWLLKANIHLAMAQYQPAQRACIALLGNTDMLIASACSLEVASYQKDIAQSYVMLSDLVQRYGLPNSQLEQAWLLQILADMAHRQGLQQAALQWLEKYTNEQKPLSLMVLWADVQLALNNPVAVITKIPHTFKQADFYDDPLLLRLAIAEQQLNTRSYWTSQLKVRIELRSDRQDMMHAADIARFYIDVESHPKQALEWANINWSMSKLAADKELLQRAQAMQKNSDSSVSE